MAKDNKPTNPKKQADERLNQRLQDLFAAQEEFPAPMSIRQAEELLARVRELEARLGEAPAEAKPTAESPAASRTFVVERVQAPSAAAPDVQPPPQPSFLTKLAKVISGFSFQGAWMSNIRVRLVIAFTVVALLSVAIVGLSIFNSYRSSVLADIRQRLVNIASITATQLDGDLHASIQSAEDMTDEAYLNMMAQGKEIVQTDPDLLFLYTMRINEEGQIYFIIDARQATDEEVVDVGTVYEEPSELLLANFTTLDHAIAEESIYTDEYGSVLSAYAPFYRSDGTLEGIVGVDIQADKVIARENEVLSSILATTGLALLIVSILGLIMGYFYTRPITHLAEVAQKVADGDLNARATVSSRDEVGNLTTIFNTMTSQLQETLTSMEKRVADRTHDLELAVEVGRTISEKVVDQQEMLTAAAEMIRTRYNLYYTQVYLTDPAGKRLILRAGTGEVGAQLLARRHALPLLSNSLNGRAALERRAVIVEDTQLSPTFLPNPLLPNTRSEMAIPLLAGNQVIGVLDMQSENPGALNPGNLAAFEVLAAQLAVAIQNAGLFAQTQEARREVEENIRRMTARGWQDFLNSIERGERLGYRFDQQEILPVAEVAPVEENAALAVPITVTGAPIGHLQTADENRVWTEQDREILQATAERLGRHLDNLRLLAQAEQYRAEAEQALRQLTREGWEDYLKDRRDLAGYLYDRIQVKPLTGANGGSAALTRPLVVRDEVVGALEVDCDAQPEGAEDILRAVAEQLSSHIENLRLAEQNQKRALEMGTVAELSAIMSTVLDPDQLLQTIVDNTKKRFGLYHAHIYLKNEAWQLLMLAAGADEVGRRLVAQQHNIPLDAEKSLVARAARERQAVIVNDVRSDPGFLANPDLPDTRAEMAVPMVVGDQVLGVFDVQSDQVGGFSTEDASIYTTLASQVAIALQNARLYAEQAATVTQLRELDRLKTSFLANMSHELRTPLNSILGFSDVIIEGLDGPLTDAMTNDLKLIQKNGQHLLHLINDVLDMAKIEAGRMNLSPERFNIDEVVDEVINITSTMAGEKNLDIIPDMENGERIEIYADRTRIRQVMLNIVNNAIKFTNEGKVTIHAGRQDSGTVLIAVKDTGIGIPPDQLETVFQEFAQVDDSTTRKVGGTGLGLPISRRLVEMHGGRLWAESAGVPGEGSIFYIELPVEARITDVVEKQEKDHVPTPVS